MHDHLPGLARQRSEECLRSVRAAVSRLQEQNASITVKAVAREARVSRNYIYSTPEAIELVRSFRGNPTAHHPQQRRVRPASEASLLTRLAAALATIEDLREENRSLARRNEALLAEVIKLQNPLPAQVTPIRRRRM